MLYIPLQRNSSYSVSTDYYTRPIKSKWPGLVANLRPLRATSAVNKTQRLQTSHSFAIAVSSLVMQYTIEVIFHFCMPCYTERNLFRISQKSEFTKIATILFFFYCTNFGEFRMDISMPK